MIKRKTAVEFVNGASYYFQRKCKNYRNAGAIYQLSVLSSCYMGKTGNDKLLGK